MRLTASRPLRQDCVHVPRIRRTATLLFSGLIAGRSPGCRDPLNMSPRSGHLVPTNGKVPKRRRRRLPSVRTSTFSGSIGHRRETTFSRSRTRRHFHHRCCRCTEETELDRTMLRPNEIYATVTKRLARRVTRMLQPQAGHHGRLRHSKRSGKPPRYPRSVDTPMEPRARVTKWSVTLVTG